MVDTRMIDDQKQAESIRKRQEWMALLAKADSKTLIELWAALEIAPDHRVLRKPEAGSVMARGRMSGTGRPFNFGELTVTRCSVSLHAQDGTELIGHSYVAGRDPDHARHAAILDALLQDPARQSIIQEGVLVPLRRGQAERRAVRAEAVAKTKVDFFTMVRGENA